MYDLCNYGESDKIELGVGIGGYGERFDVIVVVEYLVLEKVICGKFIGLLSYCYGVNILFFVMEEDQEVFCDNGVKVMVVLQFLSNGDYLKLLGVLDEVYDVVV